MQGTATIQDIATEAAGWFETAKREGRDEHVDAYFVRMKDGRPEWLFELVHEAHGDFLPDDWRYKTISEALEWIADGNDPGDAGSFADDAVDVYTGARFAWLASNLNRAGYVDEAVQELGDGAYPKGGIVEAIGWGQYTEAAEVFGTVERLLEARVDELEGLEVD